MSEELNPEIRDLNLAREAASGSRKAFDKLVTIHQQSIYRLAYRFFNNEEDTLDAVQEIFIRVFKAVRSFEGRSKFKTWIYRIAVNTCTTLAKDKSRSKKSFFQSIIDWFSRAPHPDPAKEVINREYQTELQTAITRRISKIPEVYRLPLILKDLEGKSLEEIGEILDLKEGTVKSRINRGRRMLQEALEPFFKERGDL